MNNETVLGLSNGEKAILIIISPIVGALLGWFIPVIAEWVIKIPFMPFARLLEWIASLESQWVSIIAAILGVLAGVFFIFYVFSESLKITITDEEVKLDFKDKASHIQRKELSAIYMEGKELVFLGSGGNELFRGQPESKPAALAEAFGRHLYPWQDKDPFGDQYQRWVPDHPDFPPHVNALLSAREQALKDEESEEAAVLRKDLAAQSVVIRDEEKRQYVRMVGGEEQ